MEKFLDTSKIRAPRSPGGGSPHPERREDQAANIDVAEPPAFVVEWTPTKADFRSFPDQPPGVGAPPTTIANVRHLLDTNGIVAGYNMVRKRTEISIPGLPGVADNSEGVTLTQIRSLLSLHGMHNGDTRAIVDAIASERPYNPVADWIASRAWDGVDRLPDFYATLRTVTDYPVSLKEAIMYRWGLSAVAAALMPSGFSTRLVLTLQGPQSIGKTRWCMSLVPDAALRAGVVKTDHHFDGGAKDNIITALRYWLVELGELTSSFRKDEERVKGILTRDRDVVRLPYGATDSEWPRRTVFMASVNGSDFIGDPTGSTRWGVIAVEAIDYDHGIDMQQLFAQLAVDFHAGERWWFDKAQEAELEAWNDRHRTTSIIREAISEFVNIDAEEKEPMMRRMTAKELLIELGFDSPTTAQAREAGSVLRAHFGPPKKSKGFFRWNLPIRHRDESDVPKPTLTKSKFD
ncbi:VapE domain-containing protein [Sphingomonas sp. RS2018]